MKYEHIDAFAKRVGKSRRTIYRFYNNNPKLKEETKKKGKRMIPLSHKKYWNTEILFDDNKTLSEDNRMMRNLLDYLYENDKPLANKFWGLDWSFFISIDYKHERSEDYCITKMNKLYELLEKKYGNETTLRLLFSTEPFANRNNGEHNHLMLYVENDLFKSLVLSQVRNFFKYDRVVSDEYCRYKGGIHYMMKEGIDGHDWGIVGNNLESEGVKYKNKGYQKLV